MTPLAHEKEDRSGKNNPVWIRISEPLNNPHWKESGNSIHSILEVLKNYLDKLLSKFPELISFWSLVYLGDLPHPQFPTFQEKEAKGSNGVVTRKYKQRDVPAETNRTRTASMATFPCTAA